MAEYPAGSVRPGTYVDTTTDQSVAGAKTVSGAWTFLSDVALSSGRLQVASGRPWRSLSAYGVLENDTDPSGTNHLAIQECIDDTPDGGMVVVDGPYSIATSNGRYRFTTGLVFNGRNKLAFLPSGVPFLRYMGNGVAIDIHGNGELMQIGPFDLDLAAGTAATGLLIRDGTEQLTCYPVRVLGRGTGSSTIGVRLLGLSGGFSTVNCYFHGLVCKLNGTGILIETDVPSTYRCGAHQFFGGASSTNGTGLKIRGGLAIQFFGMDFEANTVNNLDIDYFIDLGLHGCYTDTLNTVANTGGGSRGVISGGLTPQLTDAQIILGNLSVISGRTGTLISRLRVPRGTSLPGSPDLDAIQQDPSAKAPLVHDGTGWIPAGLGDLYRGLRMEVAEFASWISSSAVSGGTASEVIAQRVGTGTSANSSARRTLDCRFMAGGNNNLDRIDFTKKLVMSFEVIRTGSDAEAVGRVQLKRGSAEGALADLGVGIRIDNLALFGTSYGSTLSNVSLATTMVDSRKYIISIRHDPSVPRIDWFVNGALAGSTTTATEIPAALTGGSASWVESIINGATGGVDARMYMSPIRFWQDQ